MPGTSSACGWCGALVPSQVTQCLKCQAPLPAPSRSIPSNSSRVRNISRRRALALPVTLGLCLAALALWVFYRVMLLRVANFLLWTLDLPLSYDVPWKQVSIASGIYGVAAGWLACFVSFQWGMRRLRERRLALVHTLLADSDVERASDAR